MYCILWSLISIKLRLMTEKQRWMDEFASCIHPIEILRISAAVSRGSDALFGVRTRSDAASYAHPTTKHLENRFFQGNKRLGKRRTLKQSSHIVRQVKQHRLETKQTLLARVTNQSSSCDKCQVENRSWSKTDFLFIQVQGEFRVFFRTLISVEGGKWRNCATESFSL